MTQKINERDATAKSHRQMPKIEAVEEDILPKKRQKPRKQSAKQQQKKL